MLTNEQLFILSLLHQAIEETDPIDCTVEASSVPFLANIILRNGILLTVYPVLQKTPGIVATQLSEQLKTKYLASVRQSILQGYEGQQILDKFEDNEVDCIALKGWVIRNLYPDPAMRNMADMDILVRDYDYEKLCVLMQELGYSSGSESAWKHDDFFKEGGITIEMHKRLTDDSGIIQIWESRMWEHAVLETGKQHIWLMSDEDYYIFHIIHMHKDFLNGTLGLRRLTDTWIYNRVHPDLNREYIRQKLTEMQMETFCERIENLTCVMFNCNGQKSDENSEILLNHAFAYGIFGNSKSYKAGRIAAMSGKSIIAGKIRSLSAAVFLPVKRMKAQYPVLKKYPVLLPVYWWKRISGKLHNLQKYKKLMDYSEVSQEDYDEMKRFFEAGGV